MLFIFVNIVGQCTCNSNYIVFAPLKKRRKSIQKCTLFGCPIVLWPRQLCLWYIKCFVQIIGKSLYLLKYMTEIMDIVSNTFKLEHCLAVCNVSKPRVKACCVKAELQMAHDCAAIITSPARVQSFFFLYLSGMLDASLCLFDAIHIHSCHCLGYYKTISAFLIDQFRDHWSKNL